MAFTALAPFTAENVVAMSPFKRKFMRKHIDHMLEASRIKASGLYDPLPVLFELRALIQPEHQLFKSFISASTL